MIPAETLQKGITISALVSALSGCIHQPCDPIKLAQAPSETSVPAQFKENVSFIKDVRKFGVEQLELYECSQHYTWFDNSTKSEHTAYILTITKPTVLPKSRMAKHQFLNYFSFYRADVSDFLYLDSEKDDLTDERDYYQEKGLDVYWRSTTNYNKEGGSPITPSFLAWSRVHQVQAVFHETCHATFEQAVSSFSSELDESFCNLVGYAGTAEYFQAEALQKKGTLEEQKAVAELAEAEHSMVRHKDFSEHILSFYQQLQTLYESDAPYQKKMEERKKIFEAAKPFVGEEVNNAVLWDRYPYVAHFPLMVQLYEKQGKSVRTVIDKMKNCSEKEALACIQNLL